MAKSIDNLAMTHGGSSPAAAPQAPAARSADSVAMTHGGSSPDTGEEAVDDDAAPPDTLASDARRLLGVMGAPGGWHVDALCEATGLGASRVLGALTVLQIAGHARRVDFRYVSTSPAASGFHPASVAGTQIRSDQKARSDGAVGTFTTHRNR